MQITWYGHSAFRLDFGGKAVLIDPFFTGNPAFVSDKAQAARGVTHIVLTHGHSDHVGDALDIAKQTGAPVITNYDLCMWLAGKGLEKFDPMNTGGTTEQGGFTVTLVRADHSSGDIKDGMPIYLGNPCGAIVKAKGEPTVYHLGRHRRLFRHGSDRRAASAENRHGADRRPLHHEPAHVRPSRSNASSSSMRSSPATTARSRSSSANADKFVAEMKGHATKVIVPEKGKPVTL